MKFNGAKCRFCNCDLELEYPDDIEGKLPRITNLIFKLADRCCCNRCADYKRKMYDLTSAMSHISLKLMTEEASIVKSEKVITISKNSIDRIIRKIIAVTEDYYLMTGLQEEAFAEFRDTVLSKLDSAWIVVRTFENGVRLMAKDAHGRNQKQLPYKDA